MKLVPLLFVYLSASCGIISEQAKKAHQETQPHAEDHAMVARPNPAPSQPTPLRPETQPIPVEATPAPVEVTVNQFQLDASSTTAFVYFKLENGTLIKTSSDQTWHFAVKRTQFQTNSGTSGSMTFGVLESGTSDYSSITQCTAGALTYDSMLPASGAPGSQPYSGNAVLNAWYNYDPATHGVSSKKLVYLMSNGSSCYKMQILSYNSGVYKVLTDEVTIPPAAPVIYEQTIDATSTTDTAYLKLEGGQLTTTTADQPWLFAVKRTQFQTNSGTSGTRGVGVHNANVTDFSEVNSCADLAYTYDEILPASGAPGSQPYSGNAVLNAWYDYDFITHVVQSKQHVYLLSDGQECVKLQILSYTSGSYVMKVSELQVANEVN